MAVDAALSGLARYAAAICLALTLPAAPARSAGVEVDVELVLAVDVSRSMDHGELQLQRDGYVAAFRHPDVVSAIERGLIGRIAVTYFEWAGPDQTRMVVPWTVIAGPLDAVAFADMLEDDIPRGARGTSISGGLAYARALFHDSGFSGLRRVIDVSGDGPNNLGDPVTEVRDRVLADGIIINGLPVEFSEDRFSTYSIDHLDDYYEDCVVGGPGSFVVPVREPGQFEVAIRRKLVQEIAGRQAFVVPAQRVQRPATDCLIGEKLRRRWFREP